MQLPKEIESGNIEYKLKIIPNNKIRLIKLSTQLKWRCTEGRGVVIYFLGTQDSGSITGITADELNISIKYLQEIVDINKYTILQKNINQIAGDKFWSSIIIIDPNFNDKYS